MDGILDAADLFQLPSLRNLCLWWLNNNFSSSNCLGTYVMALLRSHLDLAESAKLYALNHFREVCESEEFLQLSPEHLYVFLSSPYLACDNEGILMKVCDFSTYMHVSLSMERNVLMHVPIWICLII